MRRIILILICFLIPLNLDARGLLASKDIKLSVKVDKREIYRDEQIQLEVTLEVEGRGGPRLVIPELEEDFEIKGKIIQNRKIIRQDKKFFVYKTVFVIVPKVSGLITIPAFVAGVYKTIPIEIRVNPAKEKPFDFDLPPIDLEELRGIEGLNL